MQDAAMQDAAEILRKRGKLGKMLMVPLTGNVVLSE
jgi:hypothetical protein